MYDAARRFLPTLQYVANKTGKPQTTVMQNGIRVVVAPKNKAVR